MVAALVQVFIGFSGLMGLILKFIGPLTIVPTIALVGLPLFETAYYFASKLYICADFVCCIWSPTDIVSFTVA